MLLVDNFYYAVLGRTMKLALRLVMQITFPSLFLIFLKHRTEVAGEYCKKPFKFLLTYI